MKGTVAVVVAAGVGGLMAVQGAVAQNVPAAPATETVAKVEKMEKVSWADQLSFKGDFRYRYETIQDDSKGDFTRQRDRIRARLQADGKISETLNATLRLSTGGDDPVSGNQTLGDGFVKKDFCLDLAYFDWTLWAQDKNAVALAGGKVKNYFGTMTERGSMDLIWDSDLTLEGAVLHGGADVGPLRVIANAGYFQVQERSGESDDTMLLAGQLGVTYKVNPSLYVTLGGSYYDYQKIEGYEVFDYANETNKSSFGNSSMSVSGDKVYALDYNLLEGFVEVGTKVQDVPVTFYGQAVQNTEADEFDTGFQGGVTVGKAKAPKSAEFGYCYAEIEKDAVVGAFTDSDRWGGGTDGKGHRMYGKYQIAKNLQVGLTYFLDDKKISDSAKTTDYARMMADLVVVF